MGLFCSNGVYTGFLVNFGFSWAKRGVSLARCEGRPEHTAKTRSKGLSISR